MWILYCLLVLVISGSFLMLILPVNMYLIMTCMLLCLAFSIYIGIHHEDYLRIHFKPVHICFESPLIVLLANDFYYRWMDSNSGLIVRVSGLLHLSVENFLILTSVVLGIAGFVFLELCIESVVTKIESASGIMKLIKEHRFKIYIFIIVIYEYLMLEISSLNRLSLSLKQGLFVFLINLSCVVLLNHVLMLLVRNTKISLMISSFLVFMWSVINYYTIQFHGSPLYLSELINAKTAAAVFTSYKYRVSFVVLIIIVLFAACIALTLYCHNGVVSGQIRFKYHLVISILSLVIAGGGSYAIINTVYAGWMPWDHVIEIMGFNVSLINDTFASLHPVSKPDGYNDEYIRNLQIGTDDSKEYDTDHDVDIILILNESFYDLNYYSDLVTDIDYMDSFNDIEGASYGYAICPTIGGGTNTSEFELLTSKSMYLLSRPAPFTYLRSNIISRSVINYLESIGYQTTGMHCETATNYSRNTAYPAAGFDNVYLGRENFSYYNSYGNRKWLDEDNYKDLIDHYDIDSEAPQFMYLLTFQNHGGWEQNDGSLDTVHLITDCGSMSDGINEYLSSIKLSAEAFSELTEYFSEIDRDVVICMVGDHAPPFVNDLTERSDLDVQNSSINKRAVPYVIWSNFGAQYDGYTDYASMTDLVPMVLSASGLPLSPFYSMVLKLHESLPIRTKEGIYVDRDFNEGSYSSDSEYYGELSEYYYLEYNSMLDDDIYRSDLFNIAE